MQLSVNGIDTFVATGGRPFDRSLPVVVLLHGAGFDHSTWALHSRWFAHHGHAVLAP
ncbi:MAG: alpha/beta hydrolase, partial [Bradyrhizobium sp.]